MEKDRAIIVGLQNYPGLDDPENGQPSLSGAENDAKAFKEWVTSKEGGDVPVENVDIILSSDYSPKFASILDALPAEREVAKAFQKLRFISLDNINQGIDPKVGRRLYIFMSGHGITPTPYGSKNVREAALLMADVDPTNIGSARYHIPGTYAATWFCENQCFDEVFLFMDCCRDIQIVPAINSFFPVKGNFDSTTHFYAFATQWSRRAREKPMPDEDGKVRGVFTKTLILGLQGAAAEPALDDPTKGVITVSSLKNYLINNMKEFIDPEFRQDPKVQEPEIDYSPKANDGKDIIIKEAPLKKFPVLIRIPSGSSGDVMVMDSGFSPVDQQPVNESPTEISMDLPRGKYCAFLSTNAKKRSVFDVKGVEDAANRRIVELTA